MSRGVGPGAHQLRQHHQEIQDISRILREGRAPFLTTRKPTCANIAKAAPARTVYVRILTEGRHADWPACLRKFRLQPIWPGPADSLHVIEARALRHILPTSARNQRDISVWDCGHRQGQVIFERLRRKRNRAEDEINMVALPANYHHPHQTPGNLRHRRKSPLPQGRLRRRVARNHP